MSRTTHDVPAPNLQTLCTTIHSKHTGTTMQWVWHIMRSEAEADAADDAALRMIDQT